MIFDDLSRWLGLGFTRHKEHLSYINKAFFKTEHFHVLGRGKLVILFPLIYFLPVYFPWDLRLNEDLLFVYFPWGQMRAYLSCWNVLTHRHKARYMRQKHSYYLLACCIFFPFLPGLRTGSWHTWGERVEASGDLIFRPEITVIDRAPSDACEAR